MPIVVFFPRCNRLLLLLLCSFVLAAPPVTFTQAAPASPTLAFVDSGEIFDIPTREVVLGDLNGDTYADAVFANLGPSQIWLNDTTGHLHLTGTLTAADSQAVALADLNGNGHLDLFFGNNGADTVWFNDGDANFTQSAQTLDNGLTIAVALADMDGDNDMDAVVISSTHIQVWRNNGAGTFTAITPQPLTGTPVALYLADFNNNGHQDALVVNSDTGFYIWDNNGNGNLTAIGPYGVAGVGAAIANFDDDVNHRVDVALASSDMTRLYLNNGSGFISGGTVSITNPTVITTADSNGNTFPDLLILTASGATVWLNDGGGAFSSSGQSLSASAANQLATADLTGNTTPDVLIAGATSGLVYFNTGGTYADSGQLLNGSGTGRSTAAADLTGNGLPDLVTVSNDQPSLVWHNAGLGEFLSRPAQALNITAGQAVALGALNNDAHIDAFITTISQPSYPWLNDGSGLLFADIAAALPSYNSRSLVLGDMNGDSYLDLIFTTTGNNQLWRNDGDAAFTSVGANQIGTSGGYALAIADLDGSNGPDVIIPRGSSTTQIFLQQSDGSFAAGTSLANPAFGVVAGHFNNDAHLDLITAGTTSHLWLGNGDGTFTLSGQAFPVTMRTVIAGDINGDGYLDVVFANPVLVNGTDAMATQVWLNDGLGNFTFSAQSLGERGQSLILADFDGDGDLDLFVGSEFVPDKLYRNRNTATLDLTTDPASQATQGQLVTLTATFSGAGAAIIAPVAFTQNGSPIAGCEAVSVIAQQAECLTSFADFGDVELQATYSGDDHNLPATSPVVDLEVLRAATVSLSLTTPSGGNPSSYGTALTFTAEVSGSGATPTGTVTFNLDGAPISGCTAETLTAGSATCTLPLLDAGNYELEASYSGDATYGPATSSPLEQIVNPATTQTALTSDPSSPVGVGLTVTLTITVTASPSPAPGTITVFLDDDPQAGCTALPLTAGEAECELTSLGLGDYVFTAGYNGNLNYAPSTSAEFNLSVAKWATTTTLAITPASPTPPDQTLTLTATIETDANNPQTLGGTVEFKIGDETLTGCSAVAITTNEATCDLSNPAPGSFAFTAHYSGDDNHIDSNSTPQQHTVSYRIYLPLLRR